MKYIKILSILIITILTISIPIITNADIDINPGDYEPGAIEEADQYIKKANIIIGIIQAVGSITAVVTLIIVGIKYMIAGTEEKAEYKSTMILYVVGCIMMLGIANIVAFIYNFANNNIN